MQIQFTLMTVFKREKKGNIPKKKKKTKEKKNTEKAFVILF